MFREALLSVADANGSRYGLSVSSFTLFARRFGFQETTQTTERELDYLTDKRLLAEVPKAISPEVRAWRITAEGRDYLAGNE